MALVLGESLVWTCSHRSGVVFPGDFSLDMDGSWAPHIYIEDMPRWDHACPYVGVSIVKLPEAALNLT